METHGDDLREQRAEVAARQAMAAAKFPVRLRKRDIEQIPQGVDRAALTGWANKKRMMELSVCRDGVTWGITGARGVGKSQMAVSIGMGLCEQGRTVRYVRAAWLFVNVRSTYQPAAKLTEEEAIEAWLKPRLLIIDEVDKRKESQHEDLLLENIVCQRHDDGKDTLLVGNLTPTEFCRCVGSSIESRMCEGGGVLVCDWPSFRVGVEARI
jgi:DNA replication protein DnaC